MTDKFGYICVSLLVLIARGVLLLVNRENDKEIIESYNRYAKTTIKFVEKSIGE